MTVATSGCSRTPSDSELLTQARSAAAEKRYADAEAIACRVEDSSSLRTEALLVAGEAATKAERYDAALEYYGEARGDLTTEGQHLAVFSAAEINLELCRLEKAEELYREILLRQPNNGITNWRMAFILSITNRRWEAVEFFFQLTKGGSANYRELGMAADVDRQLRQPDFLEKCEKRNPDGPLVRLALATEAFREGHDDAERRIEAAIPNSQYAIAAQMMQGELLLKQSDEAAFQDWLSQLPAEADALPDAWYIRGLWARERRQFKVAADCFEQAIARAPQHRRAYTALAQVLKILKTDNAAAVSAYANLLAEISQQVDKVLVSKGNDHEAIREVSSLMEQAGRIWDSCAWAVIGRDQRPELSWHADLLARLGPRLTSDLPIVDPAAMPVAETASSHVPGFDALLTEALRSGMPSRETISNSTADNFRVRFEHLPLNDFVYQNGAVPDATGVRQFEETGGGVAIIDFDGDLHPDVFLPQGLHWPIGSLKPTPSAELLDTLLRNRNGLQLTLATENALPFGSGKLQDDGFGQGCAAADFDNDGFQDLYVANAGQNRLYRNLGDGTFEDVTATAGIAIPKWTASTAFCDLTGDGLPDILDINYLEDDDVFVKVCGERACSPSAFSGCSDRLFVNDGAGGFEDHGPLTPREDAKGMGVIIFPATEDTGPSAFVANDQVANFYYQFAASDDASSTAIVSETAFAAGLAYNDHGLPLACMGAVTEDFNRDGTLDLFVTNFQDESNTMYIQDAPGLFVDSSRAWNLYATSLPFTSWGTQSIDADLDGLPDLVVGNGHVDDARKFGGDYFQRPQFFRNHGHRFEELLSDSIGDWFGGEYLCRGLAKLDWNSDGKLDFVTSRIGQSASLLVNHSTTGNFLNVSVIGTSTDRDSLGARVEVLTSNFSVAKTITAGDGYMASNQRIVQFGLGQLKEIELLTVTWPGGRTAELKKPVPNSTYIVTEGLTTGTRVARDSLSAVQVTTNGSNP